MVTVYLKGNVLPDFSDVNLGSTLTASHEESGVAARYFIDIKRSVIEVRCELNQYDDYYRNWIYLRSMRLSRAIVNMFSFARGYGFMVFMHTYIGPDGNPKKIFTFQEELRKSVTAYHVNSPAQEGDSSRLHEAIALALKEPLLHLAMEDLIATLTTDPSVTPANCARALEAIRNMVASHTTNKEERWDQLRVQLNLSKEYIQFITDQSRGPRHADQSAPLLAPV